ncbi:MAG TPA: TA system VapC family ribonuclease toxin [Stellaceae bacterium]|nr:TA system VapC family ribonuclease toxin [Stellaceae bacterium]
MILLDANLLIYSFDATSPHHSLAREWLDRQLAGVASVGFPWESITAFLRVVTNARLYRQPSMTSVAWRQIQSWLAGEPSWIPVATQRHREILDELLAPPGILGNHIHDAHLAALAIEHGLILCSADRGFSRFPQLRWLDPLTA